MVKILSNPPNAGELEMSQTPKTYWKMSVFSPKNMDKWRLWVPMVGDFLLECHRHPSVAGHTSRSKWVGLIWDLTDLSKIFDVILLVKHPKRQSLTSEVFSFSADRGVVKMQTLKLVNWIRGLSFATYCWSNFVCTNQQVVSLLEDARRLHQEMVICFCSNYDLFLSQNMVPIDIHWLPQH